VNPTASELVRTPAALASTFVCTSKDPAEQAFISLCLGEFYASGRGVPRDPAQARVLLKRACESRHNKDEQACKSLRKLDAGGA